MPIIAKHCLVLFINVQVTISVQYCLSCAIVKNIHTKFTIIIFCLILSGIDKYGLVLTNIVLISDVFNINCGITWKTCFLVVECLVFHILSTNPTLSGQVVEPTKTGLAWHFCRYNAASV